MTGHHMVVILNSNLLISCTCTIRCQWPISTFFLIYGQHLYSKQTDTLCSPTTVIHCHLKQLTCHLSSNNNNNKNTDQKDGRSSITLLHAAHNFLPIKISMTEQQSSAQILSSYRTFHHLKQTKYGISQHSNLCHRSSSLITVLQSNPS